MNNNCFSAIEAFNWAEIDTVLLDMDGTILDLGFDNFFWRELLPQKYAELNNLSLEESRRFLSDSYGSLEGKLQWYCLDFWSERLNINIPELKMTVKERVAFRPHAIAFLKFLNKHNKDVYLVTNAHPKTLEVKLLVTQFGQYFNDLHSSHYFGFPKEEQKYWHLLQQKYEFNPNKTLFIDDGVRILSSAHEFGIKYLFGIAQPDLGQDKISAAPFYALESFEQLINVIE